MATCWAIISRPSGTAALQLLFLAQRWSHHPRLHPSCRVFTTLPAVAIIGTSNLFLEWRTAKRKISGGHRTHGNVRHDRNVPLPRPRRKENTLRKLDRLKKALRHQEPDRVPISDFFWGGFIRRWREELGLPADANPYYHYDLDWICTVPNMDPWIRSFETIRETPTRSW